MSDHEPLGRYLLFGGDNYYPGGGWNDFLEHSDDLEYIRRCIPIHGTDWWQIVDTKTREVTEGKRQDAPADC